jgi:hypothetical protein
MPNKINVDFKDTDAKPNEQEIIKGNIENEKSQEEQASQEEYKEELDNLKEDYKYQKIESDADNNFSRLPKDASIAGVAAAMFQNFALSYFKAPSLTPDEVKAIYIAGKPIDEKYGLDKKIGVEFYFVGVNLSIFMRPDRLGIMSDHIKKARDKKSNIVDGNDVV